MQDGVQLRKTVPWRMFTWEVIILSFSFVFFLVCINQIMSVNLTIQDAASLHGCKQLWTIIRYKITLCTNPWRCTSIQSCRAGNTSSVCLLWICTDQQTILMGMTNTFSLDHTSGSHRETLPRMTQLTWLPTLWERVMFLNACICLGSWNHAFIHPIYDACSIISDVEGHL